MKTSSAIFRLLVLVVLCSATASYAQDGGLTFSCASWERVQGSPIHYLAGKPAKKESAKSQLRHLMEVDTPEMTRSQSYLFKRGRTVAFYRKSTTAEGEVMLQSVAEVTVPSGWSKVLFVFFPGKTQGSYRIYPIRDDREHAPFGSYQFVNLTSQPITGFIDKQKISIQAKKSSLVQLVGDRPRPVNFGVWAMEKGKRKWLQRNTLTYKPTKYLIYFFYATKDKMGRIKLSSKGIVSFKPPPPPPERDGTKKTHVGN